LLYTPVHRSRSVGPTGHHEPANAVGMIRRQLQRERAWENHGPTILPGRCAGS
jgi:hypothetical protein